MQVVDAVAVLDQFHLGLQRRQFALHAGDLLSSRAIRITLPALFGLLDQLIIWRCCQEGLGKHQRKIVLTNHEVGGLNLAHRRHATQHLEHVHRASGVFENVHRFRTDSVQQTKLAVHRPNLQPQGLGDNGRSHPSLNGPRNHAMFLHRRQAVDPLVVGVGLIVCCNQAIDGLGPELFQSLDAQMAIEQEILPWMLGVGDDDRRLDQSDRLDGTDNLGVLLALAHALAK